MPGARADAQDLRYLNMYRVYHQVLTETEGEALQLVEIERLDYESVGRRLGLTADQVKILLFQARQKLMFGMGRTLSELEDDAAV